MINSIEIENFKCIGQNTIIEIKPITLLLGPNSSGKSSIIKPFLVVKQTADSRDVQRSIQADGNYVSLGSFNDFVFKHDSKKKVTFSFLFETEGALPWRTIREKHGMPGAYVVGLDKPSVEITITLKSGLQEQVINEGTVYNFQSAIGKINVAKFRKDRGVYSGLVSYENEIVRYSPLKRSKFYDVTQSPKARSYTSFYRSELGYNLPRLLNFLTNQFEILASSIYYIGPLREEPSVLYSGVVGRPQDVGIAGEDAAAVLWVGRSERKQAELKRKVESWMDKFEISKTLEFKKLGPFFQLLLTDWHTGVKTNLTDVGFGASQLLPVIVEGYYAPERSLIIAEQPEIHLHPKAQTLLADLFIDISRQNKKILVETHSEHLLMRMQRRIADGSISNDMVAVYYCEPTGDGTKVRRINIDQYGQLGEDLPEGFFEESYYESKEHLRAIVDKKKKEKSGEGL